MFDDEGPTAVGLIATCKSLRALPRPGGVLDQDSLFIYLYDAYEAASHERAELDRKRADAQRARKGN